MVLVFNSISIKLSLNQLLFLNFIFSSSKELSKKFFDKGGFWVGIFFGFSIIVILSL